MNTTAASVDASDPPLERDLKDCDVSVVRSLASRAGFALAARLGVANDLLMP